jgi:hypothetical protein
VELDTAFDQHQTAVNADPAAVKETRRRRDLFKEALAPEDDVTETFPSGSLAIAEARRRAKRFIAKWQPLYPAAVACVASNLERWWSTCGSRPSTTSASATPT